jgi:hypothetical protein
MSTAVTPYKAPTPTTTTTPDSPVSGVGANGLAAGGSALAAGGGAALVAGSMGAGAATGAAAAEGLMASMNLLQDQLAASSAANQIAAMVRSMMMQALRDFIKDAKDTIKDMGEAGHKP